MLTKGKNSRMDTNKLRVDALRLEMAGMSQADFAEMHDLNPSYLSQVLSGHRSFGERAATNMEKKIGLKPGTLSRPPLKTSQAVMEVREGGLVYGAFASKRGRKGDINIPQYDVRASMGDGQVLPSDYIDTVRRITVSSEFLLEQGVSYTKAANLAVVTGFGESMNKTFSNGDPLIIDQGVNSVVTDGVYLFTLGGDIFVKRLQRLVAGIRVISDSDAFPPFDVTGSDASGLIIHARVLLAWRSNRL